MKKYFAFAAVLFLLTSCGGGKSVKLDEVTWKLAQMDGIPTESIEMGTDFFTLRFNTEDGMISGRTNCNRFFGKYEQKRDELKFSSMGMTRMACILDMEYEDAFMAMLSEVNRFEINNSHLTLFNGNRVLAVFRALKDEKPVE